MFPARPGFSKRDCNPNLIFLTGNCTPSVRLGGRSAHEATVSTANICDTSFSVGLPRGFSELAVFDARLYIRVRCIDEPA